MTRPRCAGQGLILLILLSLWGCARQDGEGGFYSYPDAQGRWITGSLPAASDGDVPDAAVAAGEGAGANRSPAARGAMAETPQRGTLPFADEVPDPPAQVLPAATRSQGAGLTAAHRPREPNARSLGAEVDATGSGPQDHADPGTVGPKARVGHPDGPAAASSVLSEPDAESDPAPRAFPTGHANGRGSGVLADPVPAGRSEASPSTIPSQARLPAEAGRIRSTGEDRAGAVFASDQLTEEFYATQLSAVAPRSLLREDARKRFVTWRDERGQLHAETVDLQGARAERDRPRPAGFQQIDPGRWQEQVIAVRADCCLAVLSQAHPLRAGEQRVVRFLPERHAWIRTPSGPRPAQLLALGPSVAAVRLVSYKRRGQYLHPQLLALDQSGQPQLHVLSLFQLRREGSWSRDARVEGTYQVEPGHRFLVLFIDNDPLVMHGATEPDARPAEQGELWIQALSADPRLSDPES